MAESVVVGAVRRQSRGLKEEAEDVRQLFERGHEERERADGLVVGAAGFEVVLVAVAVGDFCELEQLGDGAAGVEVVVHRGEEFLLARGGGGEGRVAVGGTGDGGSPRGRGGPAA